MYIRSKLECDRTESKFQLQLRKTRVSFNYRTIVSCTDEIVTENDDQNSYKNYADLKKPFKMLGTLRLFSSTVNNTSTNWQGFLSTPNLTKTDVPSQRLCSPNQWFCRTLQSLMPFQITNNALAFGGKDRRLIEQWCGMLTFDQSLDAKAYQIQQDNPGHFPQINCVIVNSTGLLLECGMQDHENTGPEELWKTQYAEIPITQIMDGKAYMNAICNQMSDVIKQTSKTMGCSTIL